MKNFKFRGKILAGTWVYGNLATLTFKMQNIEPGHYISNGKGVPFAYSCRPETIGMCGDTTDSFGNEIYQGDILKIVDRRDDEQPTTNVEVYWEKDALGIDVDEEDGFVPLGYLKGMDITLQVIGNTWDNPELLWSKKA